MLHFSKWILQKDNKYSRHKPHQSLKILTYWQAAISIKTLMLYVACLFTFFQALGISIYWLFVPWCWKSSHSYSYVVWTYTLGSSCWANKSSHASWHSRSTAMTCDIFCATCLLSMSHTKWRFRRYWHCPWQWGRLWNVTVTVTANTIACSLAWWSQDNFWPTTIDTMEERPKFLRQLSIIWTWSNVINVFLNGCRFASHITSYCDYFSADNKWLIL